MKRTTYLWLAGIVLSGLMTVASGAQNSNVPTATPPETSLGTYARNVRKDKKTQAAKRFDNDNLPAAEKISVVGSGSEASSDSQAQNNDQPQTAAAASDKPQVTPGQSQADRQQVYDQWKDKLSSQQSEIDLLSRELDVAQGEYKLRAAAMYGDAGERLRNEATWDKEDAAFKQKIAEKQKAVDDAKQKLSNLQEVARKAGVPSSVREADQQ
jgi:hypothetical protein